MKHLRLRLFRAPGQHPPAAPSASRAAAATKAHVAEAGNKTENSPPDANSTADADSFNPPSNVPSGPFSQQELNAQQIQLRLHEAKLDKLNFSLSPYDDDDHGKQNATSPTKSYADDNDEEGFSVTLNVPETDDVPTTTGADQKKLPPFRVKPPFLHFKMPLQHQTSLKTPAVDKTKPPPISPRFYDNNLNPWLSKPFTPFGTPAPALPSTTSPTQVTVGSSSKIERVFDREVRDCDQLWYLIVYAEEDSARKRPRWVPYFYVCDEPLVKNFEATHHPQEQPGGPPGKEGKQDLKAQVLSARATAKEAATVAATTAAAEASTSEDANQTGPSRKVLSRQGSKQPPVFTPTRRKCYQPVGTYKQIDPADTQLSITLPNNLPPIYVVFPRTSRVSDVRQWLRKHVNDLQVEEFVIRSEMPFYRETTSSELAGETLEDSGFSDTQLHVRLVSGGAYGNVDDPYSLCSNSWRTALDYNELMLDGGPVA